MHGSGRAGGCARPSRHTRDCRSTKNQLRKTKTKRMEPDGNFPPFPLLSPSSAGLAQRDGVLLPSCSQSRAWQGWMCAGCSGKPCHLPRSPTCAALAAGTPRPLLWPPLPGTPAGTPAGCEHPWQTAWLSALPVPRQGAHASEQMEVNTPGAGLSPLPLNHAANCCTAVTSSTALKCSQALNPVFFPPCMQPVWGCSFRDKFGRVARGAAWLGRVQPPTLLQPRSPICS